MKILALVDTPSALTLAKKLANSKDGQIIFLTPEEMFELRESKVIAVRECPDFTVEEK